MTALLQRPLVWFAVALGAQAIGVLVLAVLQRAAFVVPASLGEASAVFTGYGALIAASSATVACGSIGAFSAIQKFSTWKATVLVSLVASPLVFIGVAELYATLAMLAFL